MIDKPYGTRSALPQFLISNCHFSFFFSVNPEVIHTSCGFVFLLIFQNFHASRLPWAAQVTVGVQKFMGQIIEELLLMGTSSP